MAKKTKGSKKATSKKVNLVFEKPGDSKVTKKTSISKPSKTSQKSTPSNTKVPAKPKQVSNKDSKKKDYIIIGVLSFLIIVIIIFSFVVVKPDQDNQFPEEIIPDENQPQDVILPEKEFSEEDYIDLQEKYMALNLKILNEAKDYQENKISAFYQELEINENEMQTCLANNNAFQLNADIYSLVKVNQILDDSEIFYNLDLDFETVTLPVIYINNDHYTGELDYASFIAAIDASQKPENFSSIFSFGSPTLGSEQALTSITVFTSYDDPLSMELDANLFTSEFIKDYVSTNKVNLTFKPIVFSDYGLFPALVFSCAVDQDKSFEIHKKLVDLSSEISSIESFNAVYEKYADEINELEEKIENLFS